jgi:L-ascorbate metabolism protein UlaG (beta-lactamase superfamily)
MIIWLGHAAFRIAAERRIYIDPLQLKKSSPPADIILITHHHPRHCSLDDIASLLTPQTILVANAATRDRLKGLGNPVTLCAPGVVVENGGVRVEALPAYGAGHPREENGMGYVITVAGQRIYHAGDTGLIPEMRTVRCSVALLPVSGTAVLSPDEAVEACNLIRPGLAIPMHYGSFSGTSADATHFLTRVSANGIKAKLLTPQ